MLQKLQLGLWRGMELGVDCVVGMASTLLMTRREFERLVRKATFRQFLSQAGPKTALRWMLNKLTRLGGNSNWEPKSLLAPKAVVTWGADTAYFTPMLEAQWGASIFELYASSEGGIIAMQDWRRKGLVPVPTSVYLEFLPAGTVPDRDATILMDKLEEGGLYEPVITSFYGMPYLRLRQGDLLQVVGRNEKGIPQFKFHSRADDIIDLGSIARINGATLKEALAEVGVPEGQWAARKEYLDGGRPVMSIYVDVEPETAKALQWKLHRAIGKIDPHYREASFTLGYTLLRISPTKQEAVALNGSHVSSSE
jgi:hypothetical protein